MAKERQIIMLVDDNAASLTMGKNILKDKYDVYPIASGEKLLGILEKITPDLILLDIAMPEMDGYEVIRRLKASRKTQDIPVIFLTSRDDPGNELEGLSLGAIDYISKPFSPALLIQRIENHLLLIFREKELEKYNQQLQEITLKYSAENSELIITVLGALADFLEFREEQALPGHAMRIRAYLKILLEALATKKQYQEEAGSLDLQFLLSASQLHDLGKSMIKAGILNKKEKLSESEFEEIKKHASDGVEIINKISPETKDNVFLNYAKTIALTHHERWDGTGYPQGLKGTNIPLLGRLMALADGYDALVSSRPHRKAYSTEEAEKIILEGKETWLDPVLVDIFKETSAQFAELAKKA
ncbi:MAG: response regulator [Treponema sp.]|jgi:putative two-component system response regulator|nr:response regulator [Treponema sp.]